MGQKINLSENGIEDIDELRNTLNSLLKYGIIHEERVDDIDYEFTDYVFESIELPESFTNKYGNPETDVFEFLDNYGLMVYDVLEHMKDGSELKKLASKYRDIVFDTIYR